MNRRKEESGFTLIELPKGRWPMWTLGRPEGSAGN